MWTGLQIGPCKACPSKKITRKISKQNVNMSSHLLTDSVTTIMISHHDELSESDVAGCWPWCTGTDYSMLNLAISSSCVRILAFCLADPAWTTWTKAVNVIVVTSYTCTAARLANSASPNAFLLLASSCSSLACSAICLGRAFSVILSHTQCGARPAIAYTDRF